MEFFVDFLFVNKTEKRMKRHSPLCCRYLVYCVACLEPLWGALEMLTFFLMVNTGVAVLCAVFYYLLYMFTFNTDLLFKVHIHGLSGYLAG